MTWRKNGDRYEHVEQADFSHLRYAVISGCGFPNAQHNFEASSVTKPFLALVKEAGQQYAQTGTVSAELMEKLSVPMIPDDVYADICNKGQ